MSAVTEGALHRVTQNARKHAVRVAPDDATKQSREHPAFKPGAAAGVGVLVALAQAGIRLTLDQRRLIDRLMKAHPELRTCPFTPARAVEKLMAHGVHFSDRQLELVSDEATVTGLRRLESAFDDVRTTASHPAYRPAHFHDEGAAEEEAPARGFVAWVKRLFQRPVLRSP